MLIQLQESLRFLLEQGEGFLQCTSTLAEVFVGDELLHHYFGAIALGIAHQVGATKAALSQGAKTFIPILQQKRGATFRTKLGLGGMFCLTVRVEAVQRVHSRAR